MPDKPMTPSHPPAMNILKMLLTAVALSAGLSSCAVVTVAGAAVGAVISVAGAVVSTGVEVTGKVVGAGVDAVAGSDEAKK